jgi:hypothetical protein
LSRYSQQQLRDTTHQHLLREEPGCWLNLDAFHMGVGAMTRGARACRQNLSCTAASCTTSLAGSKRRSNAKDAATFCGRMAQARIPVNP